MTSCLNTPRRRLEREVFHLRGFGGLGPGADQSLWTREAPAVLEATGGTARPPYHMMLSGCRRQFDRQDWGQEIWIGSRQ